MIRRRITTIKHGLLKQKIVWFLCFSYVLQIIFIWAEENNNLHWTINIRLCFLAGFNFGIKLIAHKGHSDMAWEYHEAELNFTGSSFKSRRGLAVDFHLSTWTLCMDSEKWFAYTAIVAMNFFPLSPSLCVFWNQKRMRWLRKTFQPIEQN